MRLKEVVPRISLVAVLGDPHELSYELMLTAAKVAGRSLGVQLQVLEARDPNEFDGAFAAMVRQRAGALIVLRGAVSFRHRRLLADRAAKSRLPAIYSYREYVDAGGFLAYGPNASDVWRRAAAYVDKILRGAKPSDLPSSSRQSSS